MSSADAAIKIYETSREATLLGKIKHGSCRVRGSGGDRYFRAKAQTTSGAYRLRVVIDGWRGYGSEYDFRFGTSDPGEFHVYGPGGPYSNLYAPPGTQGNDAGGLAFANRGARMSVGFLPTPNESFDEGVVLGGAMSC